MTSLLKWFFIWPECDQWLPLSLTDKLTHSCLEDWIDVTLAWEETFQSCLFCWNWCRETCWQKFGAVSATLFFVHLMILMNQPQLLPLPFTLSKTNQHCRRVHCQLKARPSMIQAGAWPEMGLLQLAASSSLRPARARQLLLPSPVSLFTFSHTLSSTAKTFWHFYPQDIACEYFFLHFWGRCWQLIRESRKNKCFNQIDS